MPLAPGRLSMTMGCDQASVSFWPTARARMSVVPPGEKGTTIRTGLPGYCAGAGGNSAAEMVARAPADGYTVLNGNNHAINRTLYRSLPYDDKDFVPITKIATGPTVIVVNNNLPVATLQELIAFARANPGKLFNAGAGYGSAPHLAAVLFESVAGVKFTSVQFKGGGPAAQSRLAGDTHVMFATSPTVMGSVRSGRLRALAVSMRAGSPAVPGIPGSAEAGLPAYDY